MATLRIVSQFDVPSNIAVRVCSRGVMSSVDSFVFECGEEGFCHCVVVADSGPSDRLSELVSLQHLSESGGRVVGGFKWSSQHLVVGGVLGGFG